MANSRWRETVCECRRVKITWGEITLYKVGQIDISNKNEVCSVIMKTQKIVASEFCGWVSEIQKLRSTMGL